MDVNFDMSLHSNCLLVPLKKTFIVEKLQNSFETPVGTEKQLKPHFLIYPHRC